MSTVQDIKNAILTLDDQARRDLLAWFEEQEEREWDEQIGRDFDAGKLDRLIQNARNEAKQGTLRPGP
jgi:FPC/CPF motif-containing protein YcgG